METVPDAEVDGPRSSDRPVFPKTTRCRHPHMRKHRELRIGFLPNAAEEIHRRISTAGRDRVSAPEFGSAGVCCARPDHAHQQQRETARARREAIVREREECGQMDLHDVCVRDGGAGPRPAPPVTTSLREFRTQRPGRRRFRRSCHRHRQILAVHVGLFAVTAEIEAGVFVSRRNAQRNDQTQ